MTAYWIATYDEVTDQNKVAAYATLAGPALMAAGGRFLARGNPEQVYELGEETRTVLIEFPSVEAARAAHDTPAYAEALAALGDGPAVTSGSCRGSSSPQPWAACVPTVQPRSPLFSSARASVRSSNGVAIESFHRLNTPNMHTTPSSSTIWLSDQCSVSAA